MALPPAVSDEHLVITQLSPRAGVPVSVVRARRHSRDRILDWIRLAFAIVLFGVALMSALPAPTRAAWLIGLVASEGGHWLAPVALLTLIPGWRASAPGRIAVALGVASTLLFVAPMAQALRISHAVTAEVARAWGQAPRFAVAGAPAREAPVELFDLYAGVRIGESRQRTLVYAADAAGERRLDLYLPADSTAAAPLLVMVHGGSWKTGDRTELPAMARYFAARGIAVAMPDYRLAPAHPFPAAQDDVARAVQFLAARSDALGIDPRRIVYLGRSAGAQLALSAAFGMQGNPAVRGAVSLYGPLDLRWGFANPGNPRVLDGRAVLRDYLGGSPAEVPGAYDAAAPISAVSPHSPPVLLIHGGRDDLVSPVHMERFAARMEWAGQRHLAIELPWATHGCDAILRGPCGQITLYAVERFLADVMR
jgi:acetyl esterase/lipase